MGFPCGEFKHFDNFLNINFTEKLTLKLFGAKYYLKSNTEKKIKSIGWDEYNLVLGNPKY